MNEYITKEEALLAIMQEGCKASHVAVIRAIPTADVVEVVRCKDCVCRSGSSSVVHHCTLSGIPVDDDDFCSYGERRADNER